MADESPIYDLLLLLSTEAPDERRASILSAVESAITNGGGTVERNDDWGRRPMAYEIRHTPEAEYHLLQFQAPGSLIEELSHTLRITDGVLRFRIIKVRRGTPEWKSSPPPVVAAVSASGFSSEGARSGSPRPPASEADEPEQAPAEEPAPTAVEDEGSEPASATAAAGSDGSSAE